MQPASLLPAEDLSRFVEFEAFTVVGYKAV
jgi:hypothetical protein